MGRIEIADVISMDSVEGSFECSNSMYPDGQHTMGGRITAYLFPSPVEASASKSFRTDTANTQTHMNTQHRTHTHSTGSRARRESMKRKSANSRNIILYPRSYFIKLSRKQLRSFICSVNNICSSFCKRNERATLGYQ